MRKSAIFFAAALLTGILVAGCAGPEQKLGRGFNNMFEFARMGEMRRTVEQTAMFQGPDSAYGGGVIKGFDRSMARFGIGIYEVVTFPLPPYHAVATNYLSPNPAYPDSYTPHLIEDANFASDTYTGFSGGDVAPFIPGSRFRVFDN